MPVLEGMQFGAPTLASNATSIPEVAGKAAILLDPEDVSAWAQSMLSLASDRLERDRLGLAAREQASSFDWNFSTVALLKIYDEALASKKRCVVS